MAVLVGVGREAWYLGVKRRVTAFIAGRIVESFFAGSGFEEIDGHFRLVRGTSETVFRRFVLRSRAAKRRPR